MKRIEKRWMLLVMVLTLFIYDGKAETVNRSKYDAGGVPTIHPKGWLQTMLQRQHDGLTGHPEALSYPYNSCLWAGEISRNGEAYGENWW